MDHTPHPSLVHAPADLVGGRWIAPRHDGPTAKPIQSRSPARPNQIIYSGASDTAHVAGAVAAARAALPVWSRLPLAVRATMLRRFAKLAAERAPAIADLICDEVGKPLWDAKAEAGLLSSKVEITLDESSDPSAPLRRVSGYEVSAGATRTGACWFRPHGVMAVVGPFNFPLHLPNGHIIPALAMGNTIVFKPSDKAPACGQALVELFDRALREELGDDRAAGVINLVQGGADVASALVAHRGVDGVLFTGSWPVGRKILEANLDRPGTLCALEMGGSNAAVIMPDADLRQAAIECARSAFITAGQRCTCTRRIIVHQDIAARFTAALCKAASTMLIGDPRAGVGGHPVFMGPVISEQARKAVLTAQTALRRAGSEVLVEAVELSPGPGAVGGWFVSPGVVRVQRFISDAQGHTDAESLAENPGADVEIFGPLVRLTNVSSLDDAIEQASATRFGLAASIFTRDADAIDRFRREVRAGCINVNTGTAGASSKLPFGGLGLSGNHRPAGSFSLDYCAYPVAGMNESGSEATLAPGMNFDDSWLR